MILEHKTRSLDVKWRKQASWEDVCPGDIVQYGGRIETVDKGWGVVIAVIDGIAHVLWSTIPFDIEVLRRKNQAIAVANKLISDQIRKATHSFIGTKFVKGTKERLQRHLQAYLEGMIHAGALQEHSIDIDQMDHSEPRCVKIRVKYRSSLMLAPDYTIQEIIIAT